MINHKNMSSIREADRRGTSVYQNLIYSLVGTSIAEILTLPICTVKTNYQNTKDITVGETAKKIYKTNGIKGFYNASLPALGSQLLSSSTKYVFYRYLEDMKYEHSNKIINGCISGIASSIITHPVDFMRVNIQMNQKISNVMKENGFKVLYRGYSKTFSKAAVGNSLYLPIYEYYYDYFNRKKVSGSGYYSAFLSAFTSTLILHPIDYLKTRHIFGQPLFEGYDIRKYYKGLPLNMARILPHFMIMMTTIEWLKRK